MREKRYTELDNGQVSVLQFYSFTENTVWNKLLPMVNHKIAMLPNRPLDCCHRPDVVNGIVGFFGLAKNHFQLLALPTSIGQKFKKCKMGGCPYHIYIQIC